MGCNVTHVLPGLERLTPAVACGVVTHPSAGPAVLFTPRHSSRSALERNVRCGQTTHQVEGIGRRVYKAETLYRNSGSVVGRDPHPKRECISEWQFFLCG